MNNKQERTIEAPFAADESSPYIFISYAHADRNRVFPILKPLYEKGWRIWYDEGLNIGDNYYETLEQHIKDCELFLLFASFKSSISYFVNQKEIPLAIQSHRRISVCTLDEGIRFSDIDLSEYPHVEPSDLAFYLETVSKLTRTVKRKAEGHRYELPDMNWKADGEYEFEIIDQGTVLKRHREIWKKEVFVPAEYPPDSGICVYAISGKESFEGAFNSEILETVHLPEGLKVLESNSFQFHDIYAHPLKRLKHLYVPSSVEYIDEWAFSFGEFYNPFCSKIKIHCSPDSVAMNFFSQDKKHFTVLPEKNSKNTSQSITKSQPIVQELEECCCDIANRYKTGLFDSDRPYVFCSYDNASNTAAKRIIGKLVESGCFLLDANSLKSCDQLDPSFKELFEKFDKLLENRQGMYTENQLKHAACLLAFVNDGYFMSERCNDLKTALDNDIPIAAYLTEKCNIPLEFSFLHDVHLLHFETGTEEERVTKLLNWLTKYNCHKRYEIPDFTYELNETGLCVDKLQEGLEKLHIYDDYGGLKAGSIDGDAIVECFTLRELHLPKTLTKIVDYYLLNKKMEFVDVPVFTLNPFELHDRLYEAKDFKAEHDGDRLKGKHRAISDITLDPDNPDFICDGKCIIRKSSGRLYFGCAESTIPQNGLVKSISPMAFACTDIRHVVIPEGVTEIEGWCFESCCQLEEVSISDTVKAIRPYAFENCTNLKRVVLGKGVTFIGKEAFLGCTQLTNIISEGQRLKIQKNAFKGSSIRL